MQCPPTRPGRNGRKFHFVPAASRTSRVSMPRRLKISASSLMRAMLTSRWVFSMTFAASLVVSTLAMENPNGVAVTILSLIPFFGPSLMFLRIAIGAAPAWQIAASIVLLVVTIVAVTWIAAKIYRVGVLMYGKRPTLPELARWLRYS